MSSVQKKSDRIPAAERREQILEAATRVFGELGYAGATTDRVAKAAGISQPYVVRLFGTKEQLFIEVLERTCDRILEMFDEVIATQPAVDAEAADSGDGHGKSLHARLGSAYVELVQTDRGILLSLMQGFILGQDPGIGPVARAGFMRIYGRIRELFGPEQTMDFLANGMLINTLVSSGLTTLARSDDHVRELFDCAFGSKANLVLESLERA